VLAAYQKAFVVAVGRLKDGTKEESRPYFALLMSRYWQDSMEALSPASGGERTGV